METVNQLQSSGFAVADGTRDHKARFRVRLVSQFNNDSSRLFPALTAG
jgi:hypothetical protein